MLQAGDTSDRWELLGSKAYLPAQARKIRFRVDAVRATGSTNDVFIDHAFVSVSPRGYGIDTGALGNTAGDVTAAAQLKLLSPDLYKDWEKGKPIDIRWDSYGNVDGFPGGDHPVARLGSGPQIVTQITSNTPDDGAFTWIAGNSGIDYGTYGLRIEVTLAANETVRDRSSESFTVPENTTTYYVNDRSNSADLVTSTLGNNRATGKLISAPKPYPNNVLRIYSLGAGSTLTIDTGNYPLLSPLVVSNVLGVGDDEGFVLQGPPGREVKLSHANPLTAAPVLELKDADQMAISNLTLVGGTIGFYVHAGSTGLNVDNLTSLNALQRGMWIVDGSSAGTLNQLTVNGSAGPGFSMTGGLGIISNSSFLHNDGVGMELIDTPGAVVSSSKFFDNYATGAYGVRIVNSAGQP